MATSPMVSQRSRSDFTGVRAASVIGTLDEVDGVAGFVVDRLQPVRRKLVPFPEIPFDRAAKHKGHALLAQETLGGRPGKDTAEEALDLRLKFGQVGGLGSMADHR